MKPRKYEAQILPRKKHGAGQTQQKKQRVMAKGRAHMPVQQGERRPARAAAGAVKPGQFPEQAEKPAAAQQPAADENGEHRREDADKGAEPN